MGAVGDVVGVQLRDGGASRVGNQEPKRCRSSARSVRQRNRRRHYLAACEMDRSGNATKTFKGLALVLASAVLSHATEAAPRSQAAKAAFQRANPCPATGQHRGKCPGYVIDHVHPICAGGPDAPSNMQWQTAADAKLKDREERRLCAKRRMQ